MTDSNKVIQELDKILDREKAALMSGDLDGLAELVEEKEKLVQILNTTELSDSSPLTSVSGKVQHNKILLESALEGIRSAARRLAELRQVRKSLDTYDRNGNKNRIEEAEGRNLEKRA